MPQKGKMLGISHSRPRNVYHERTQMQFMCRVCLTRSNTLMYNLIDTSVLVDETNVKLSIHQALEKVTASEITLYGKCPHYICPVCFSILKMSLKFIYQFEESQKKVNKQLGDHSLVSSPKESKPSSESNSVKEHDNNISAPVELIYGENKYSLDDLLVVEKAEEENCDFKGFLNNLGKEVTATFADTSDHSNLERINSEDTDGEITISLVEKDKVLPVRELQLDEETNTIKCVVENAPDIEEEILKLQIESDDSSDTDESIKMEAKTTNVDAFIIVNGIEKMDPESVSQRQKAAQLQKDGIKCDKIKVIEDIFEKEIRYPCDICGKVFNLPIRLKSHKRRIHSNKSRDYYCDICGYKNKTLSAHNYHKTRHTGKIWVCEICSKCYYTKAALKVHMESHINKRQHLCTVCGKGFNYANALMYHMRLHTGEKNYECKYCGQKFSMSHTLNRHVRCHTGERPYQCRYCDMALRSKGELNCHESGHTGRRPYHCKYCRKGFSKTHNLKLHLLSHRGPHKCELCKRSFIEPTILAMHYKISHRDIDDGLVKAEVETDN